MDEVRQADGMDRAGHPGWTESGGTDPGGGRVAGVPGQRSPHAAAPEPAVEPLALLTTSGPGEERPPQGRRYAPGLDDDTPIGGVPAVEPPLWREAARHSAGLGYGAQLAQYPDLAGPTGEFTSVAPPQPRTEPAGLPQRVPAEPDVPEMPESESGNRERWTAPELAWIADQLKRADVPQEPAEGLDVDAVLDAVREVPGVRSASVRPNPNGVHTLRLDLADDADPGQVSRLVARLLEDRMGLSAAPNEATDDLPASQAPPWSAPATTAEATPGPAAPPDATPAPATAQAADAAPTSGMPPAAEAGPTSGTSRAPEAAPGSPGEPATGAAAKAEPAAHLRPPAAPSEDEPEVVSRPLVPPQPGLRVVIDQVRVDTVGLDAVVEVELSAGERRARGRATGAAVDTYVARLAAVAAADAIDQLLRAAAGDPVPDSASSRCFVEHTGVVPFGTTEVAVVVLLLACGGWVERLTGAALAEGDPRQAMVRATLGAVNRRLEALLG